MENNKREWPPVRRPRRRGINIRPVALFLALVLLIGGAAGGAIAWFMDSSDPVENTFTVGNIDIDLTETKTDFKMVPGCTIEKDPVVTVEAGSEDAWIFIKVEESDNLDDFIAYEVDGNNWTKLESGVYYTQYTNRDDVDISIKVLKDQKVTVLEEVTKEMMDDIEADKADAPTLTFTAYAIQKAGFDDAVAAWEKVKPTP